MTQQASTAALPPNVELQKHVAGLEVMDPELQPEHPIRKLQIGIQGVFGLYRLELVSLLLTQRQVVMKSVVVVLLYLSIVHLLV